MPCISTQTTRALFLWPARAAFISAQALGQKHGFQKRPGSTSWVDDALVFLDDHMAHVPRLDSLRKKGFRHVILEDNYLPGLGDLKVRANAGKWAGRAKGDEGMGLKQLFARAARDPEARRIQKTLEVYWEFPPLVHWDEKIRAPGRIKAIELGPSGWPERYPEPILRPDACANDIAFLALLTQATGVGPAACGLAKPGCATARLWHQALSNRNGEAEAARHANMPKVVRSGKGVMPSTVRGEWLHYNFISYVKLRSE